MVFLTLFLVGFGLAVSGGVTLILYLNFIPAGLSWIDYFLFAVGRLECYFLPLGLLLIIIAIYKYPG
ncbi:hypothetical protein [Virgibacillus senegalensis]|uniref:hypothetical protein n=1 Tax=Virgibacillus senegalensis TaxID=1499679 RepID=UPI00069E91CB|nr:hypothetical protein [Virgibacillus senegalensis]